MAYKPHKFVREKVAKKEFQKQFWRVFLIEAGLFSITSLLAIVTAFKLNKLVVVQKLYLPSISLQDFFFSFLFITFFILLFVLLKKADKTKELIFKGFFILAVFWGGMTVINLWMPVFGSILIMGVLMIWWLEKPTVSIHDFLMVLCLAGASAFFGLGFDPSVIVLLLMILSFYDFIAVYKTKHMVAMAKEMIEKKVIMGFIIPKELKFFKSKLKEVKSGTNFFILGGGDIVFPCLLAVSVVPFGFWKAFIVAIFSLFGSLLSYWLFINQEEKSPIPALPPIALLSIVGYLITFLF